MGTGLIVCCSGARTGDAYSLSCILDVCVYSNRILAFAHGLKSYDALARECGAVERKGDLNSAFCFLWCEFRFCGYLLAAGYQFLAGVLVHKDTGHGIFLIWCQVLVCNDILDRKFFSCVCDMVACCSISSCGADLRIVHGLVLILDVCMYSNFFTIVFNGLECYHALACQCCSVEGKGKCYFSVSFFSSELCGSGDFLTVCQEGLTCCFVHERAFYGIGLAWDEVCVSDNIVYSYFFFCQTCMCTGLSVGRSGMRIREVYGLAFIVDLSMNGNFVIIVLNSLECYDTLARECGTIKFEGQCYAAVSFFCCEFS